MIDREAPRKRPNRKAIGYQSWRELLFLHWRVDPAVLAQLIPADLELDLWEGQALVGIVPFSMREVRPWWAPRLLGFNFLETNLRVYVTHRGEPGVFFFSLEAASYIAVQTAKFGWSLPYFYARMSQSLNHGHIHYSSQRLSSDSPELEVHYRVGPAMATADPNSLEFFLLERYLLFTERHGKILRGQVHHKPYPICQAEVLELTQTLTDHINIPIVDPKLYCVHYSPGVDVEIFPLKPSV